MSVALSSNNTSVTVPASVNIGAGLSSATFNATVAAVTSNQTADARRPLSTASRKTFSGYRHRRGVDTDHVANLHAFRDDEQRVRQLHGATWTPPQPPTAVIALTSNNSGLLSVPAHVTVTAGQSSATFAASSGNREQ